MPQPKKKDIPVTLAQSDFTALKQFADDHGISEQEAAKRISLAASQDVKVLRSIAPYFKEALILPENAWLGEWRTPSYEHEFGDLSFASRVHVRVGADEWSLLSPIWHAMACPKSHAVALLIIKGLQRSVTHVTV